MSDVALDSRRGVRASCISTSITACVLRPLSLELFRTRIDVRLPFLSISRLPAGPAQCSGRTWRDDTSIHRALVAAGNPALLRVRNSNTGAAVNAPRLVEDAMDKLNTLLKRANVKGFRHYHNFDGWMQRMLVKSVQEELMAPSSRIREWFRDDVLKRLIDETASGAASHGHVLQALLILGVCGSVRTASRQLGHCVLFHGDTPR